MLSFSVQPFVDPEHRAYEHALDYHESEQSVVQLLTHCVRAFSKVWYFNSLSVKHKSMSTMLIIAGLSVRVYRFLTPSPFPCPERREGIAVPLTQAQLSSCICSSLLPGQIHKQMARTKHGGGFHSKFSTVTSAY